MSTSVCRDDHEESRSEVVQEYSCDFPELDEDEPQTFQESTRLYGNSFSGLFVCRELNLLCRNVVGGTLMLCITCCGRWTEHWDMSVGPSENTLLTSSIKQTVGACLLQQVCRFV